VRGVHLFADLPGGHIKQVGTALFQKEEVGGADTVEKEADKRRLGYRDSVKIRLLEKINVARSRGVSCEGGGWYRVYGAWTDGGYKGVIGVRDLVAAEAGPGCVGADKGESSVGIQGGDHGSGCFLD
jgi:hypothetical protein